MRIRTAVATLGLALTGAAAAATCSAGSAAAITPFSDPSIGIYAGVSLDRNEAAALNNSPLPGMLNGFLGDNLTYILDPASRLPQDDDYVYADPSDVISEVAHSRFGEFGLAWVNPSWNNGHPYMVVEVLDQ
ncbi:hypothetical protein [Nocardia inohanensis]|uniref:hypothetical protein n=1 Tax=Nocardia inohanensis TaxID=209246 RepID=UPI000AD7CF0F|nr:hypothetical protein [Nocardia inohanensis]